MVKGVNPVVKLMALVMGAIMVFLIDSLWMLLCFVIVLLMLKILYGVKGRFGKSILALVVAIFMAQVIFVPEGAVIMDMFLFEITRDAIARGFLISGRFFSLISMSWIFVGTTSPGDLSSGLADVGVPYRFSFLLILAMRFAPIFQLELSNVQQAQSVRGLKVGSDFKGLIRSVRYTTMPLLFSAMYKVNTLASSMEGRSFGLYRKKTFLHPVKFTPWDYALTITLILFCFEIYYLNQLL